MSAERQPPNAEEMLRALFNQTAEQALILLDPSGKIIGWFPAAQEMFGYLPHEVLGQPASMLFTPENVEAGMDKYERDVARTDVEAEDDRWMLRKDRARFWATGILCPIRDAGGQLIGFGKLLRDRTDMRAITESLQNQTQQLSESNQRKNQFISTLAHELRNPLASITQAVELLKIESNDGEHTGQVTEIMQRELAAMGRLVDDLLDATRVGSGKVQLRKRPEELRRIVESAVEGCRHHLNPETQSLHILAPETPIIVDVDADRARQIFMNLIQNAANFTRNGGTIWLKVSLEEREGVVKVEDNGVGISPELLPHIFELFTQAEFSSERTDAGLGIGLSVVRDLTRLHGGSVQVRSDGIGKGSEFTVRFPLVEHRPDTP